MQSTAWTETVSRCASVRGIVSTGVALYQNVIGIGQVPTEDRRIYVRLMCSYSSPTRSTQCPSPIRISNYGRFRWPKHSAQCGMRRHPPTVSGMQRVASNSVNAKDRGYGTFVGAVVGGVRGSGARRMQYFARVVVDLCKGQRIAIRKDAGNRGDSTG